MAVTLTDRTIIVTGAGSGIGRATALQIAACGAHVVVADLVADPAEETVRLIAGAGGNASCVVGDVSDQAVVDRIVADAREHGALKGLVNNAGVMDRFAGAAETDDLTWGRCLQVNLTAPFLLSRAALPAMLEAGGGSIVNVGSEASVRGGAAGAAYTASKHGVVGLTRNTAYTYAKRGVRANAILPGPVNTGISSSMDPHSYETEDFQAIAPVHGTLLRMAQPEEIAPLIVFLLSDEAVNVNGAIVPTDGGWSAG